MNDFLRVKQDAVLYHCCIQARDAYARGEAQACILAVRGAYLRMAQCLTQNEDTDGETLIFLLKEQELLTDVSLAAYRSFLTENVEGDLLYAQNAYISLEAEIERYTGYYQKGVSPTRIASIANNVSDGIYSTRQGRGQWDTVFGSVLVVGLILIGGILLLLSAVVPSMSNWLIGGILIALTGVLFGVLNMKVKK